MNRRCEIRGVLIVVFAALICSSCKPEAETDSVPAVAPIYHFASQPGRPTYDVSSGGGNPFASAFVDLMGRETLSYIEFRSELSDMTAGNSWGRQHPGLPGIVGTDFGLLPAAAGERRVALVIVYSDYSSSAQMQSLPGASRDFDRISESLREAGFEVSEVLDPRPNQLLRELQRFRRSSSGADLAVLYTTGHGVEIDGIAYLLPGSHAGRWSRNTIADFGIPVSDLASSLGSGHMNLVFFAGCRNNPLPDN